ncbi:hypothetical protein Tco_0626376 [Tanacetum coccineum]|uniref:Uncharacterized protein n=1 Tax=Tanacetum coccineum TaxID=301880 RepID=A0ABQ4WJF2_9ASTR
MPLWEAGGKDVVTNVSTGIHLTNSNGLRRLFQLKKVVRKQLQNGTWRTTRMFHKTYGDTNECEAEAVQIILTGIDNDIYSIVDAYPNDVEIWKAIFERLKQGPIRFYKMKNKALSGNKWMLESSSRYTVLHFNYNRMAKEKEIDKLMALISLSIKKSYKPTNNNLRTSSNTSRANQDNTPRINRGTGYDNQRVVNVARARENVARECQKLKRGKRMQLSKVENAIVGCKQSGVGFQLNIQEVTPCCADNYGTAIFDVEPLQNVKNNDDIYNVFAIESEHPEQPEFVNDTYPVEQDEHNIIIDSLDMIYDREQDDQDDNDLANQRNVICIASFN